MGKIPPIPVFSQYFVASLWQSILYGFTNAEQTVPETESLWCHKGHWCLPDTSPRLVTTSTAISFVWWDVVTSDPFLSLSIQMSKVKWITSMRAKLKQTMLVCCDNQSVILLLNQDRKQNLVTWHCIHGVSEIWKIIIRSNFSVLY